MENNQMREQIKKFTIRFAVVFIVTLALLTYFSSTINNMLLPSVNTVSPKMGSLSETIYGVEKLVFIDTRDIVLPTGFTVSSVAVSYGDKVAAGDVLASIDCVEYKQIKNLYEVKLSQAEGKAENLNNSLKNAYTKAEKNSLNRQIHEAELELDSVTAEVNAFLEYVDSDGAIRSPKELIITDVYLTPYESVPAKKPLLSYAEPDAKYSVVWQLNENQGENFKRGDSVYVKYTAYDEAIQNTREFTEVTTIEKTAFDKETGKYTFYAYLEENQDKLKLGMEITFSVQAEGSAYDTIIPKTAIHESGGMKKIYVAKQDTDGKDIVEEVPVNIIASNDFYAAIDTELSFSENVVVFSTKSLSNGAHVKIAE